MKRTFLSSDLENLQTTCGVQIGFLKRRAGDVEIEAHTFLSEAYQYGPDIGLKRHPPFRLPKMFSAAFAVSLHHHSLLLRGAGGGTHDLASIQYALCSDVVGTRQECRQDQSATSSRGIESFRHGLRYYKPSLFIVLKLQLWATWSIGINACFDINW